jgi:hypothetical protein
MTVWVTGDGDAGAWEAPVEHTVREARRKPDRRGEVEVLANYYHPEAVTEERNGAGHCATWEFVPLDPRPGAAEIGAEELEEATLAAFTTREAAERDLAARCLLRAQVDLGCAFEKLRIARELTRPPSPEPHDVGVAFMGLQVIYRNIDNALAELGAVTWPEDMLHA